MPELDLSKEDWQSKALKFEGPSCLVIRAGLSPVAGASRFQPSGFPEIGHVIYEAPRRDGSTEKVCIVDSCASMANHLETVCLQGPAGELHPDLEGIPYVRCVTDLGDAPAEGDKRERLVCTTLTEGHRLSSDYFLDGLVELKWKPAEKRESKKKSEKSKQETTPAHWEGPKFREKLRQDFGVKEIKEDKTYFIWPENWWAIYKTLFRHDPNSLVHGVMFAKEQIKLSRLLSAHMEALGAARVGSSGVKFDRLQKTKSGQPIFAVDEETAQQIVATFVVDLALLRSYGRDKEGEKEGKGLTATQKRLLLDLSVWKIKRLLEAPFRFRTGCHLTCTGIGWYDETDGQDVMSNWSNEAKWKAKDIKVDVKAAITKCEFSAGSINVYYPAADLFKVGEDDGGKPAEREQASEDDSGNSAEG